MALVAPPLEAPSATGIAIAEDMIKTAVVILNYNGEHHLKRFLPSVVAHTPEEVRIIVADNASEDGSLDMLHSSKEFQRVETIVLDHNYGFAAGYNRALKQIDAECYILLNSDVEVTSGWVEPLVATLTNHPQTAAVAPKIRAVNTPEQFEYAGAAGGYIDILGYPFCRGRILSTVESDNGQYDDPKQVFWASGAAFCCRADVFRQVRGFDEDFFAHMEEIDLCWRMQLAGYKIEVEPRSVVYHLGGGTLPNESPRKLYLNYRNNLAMLFKCSPMWQRALVAVLRPLCDMVSMAIYLLKGEFSLAGATLRAYIDFAKWHGELAVKRNETRKSVKSESEMIYRGSIVLRYIFCRKFGRMM